MMSGVPRCFLVLLGVFALGCADEVPITATYRGYPNGLGDPVRQKLGAAVTESFGSITATPDAKSGTFAVTVAPTAKTMEALRTAGFPGIGPCLPDATTYSFYLLRMYDAADQLLAVSNSSDAPITCRDGRYVFTPFEAEKIQIVFPANATLMRDAKHLEFSVWLEPFGERGAVSDAARVHRTWKSRTRQEF